MSQEDTILVCRGCGQVLTKDTMPDHRYHRDCMQLLRTSPDLAPMDQMEREAIEREGILVYYSKRGSTEHPAKATLFPDRKADQ